MDQSEEDLLAAIDATIRHFDAGDVVEGRVVKVGADEVLVDVGFRTEGVIPSNELSLEHDIDPHKVVTVGDEVKALVLQKEDREGRLILSKKRAEQLDWRTVESIFERGGVIVGTVVSVAKDGLIVDVGVPGFIGRSMLEKRGGRDLKAYLGTEIEAKILDLDKRRKRVILSQRAWLDERDLREQYEERGREIDQLRDQLAERGIELEGLTAKIDESSREVAEWRVAAERSTSEAHEARALSRALWAAMTPEGRLAYFESSSSWLPEWVVRPQP